jgi:hypothetical protein
MPTRLRASNTGQFVAAGFSKGRDRNAANVIQRTGGAPGRLSILNRCAG